MASLDWVSGIWREIDVSPLGELAASWSHGEQWDTSRAFRVRVVVDHGKVLPMALLFVLLKGVAAESGAEPDMDTVLAVLSKLVGNHHWVTPWPAGFGFSVLENNRVAGWLLDGKRNDVSRREIVVMQ